jgi:HAD superfamily hydrolase (TIGR01549 family)
MRMKEYKAIVFDLFSTIAIWQPDRLPLFNWRGKTSHSTMGALQESIESLVTEASFATFVDALDQANETLAARRASEMREITSLERFELALRNAGYAASSGTRDLAQTLSLQHMDLLANAVEIPPAHVKLLERLSSEYPLALVSNFDHGTTARRILNRDGAADYLSPIVVSDEHGWRKPHRKIFIDTLETLGVEAGEALYVGDSPEDDIVGAKTAGMDVAWVNARKIDLPAIGHDPDLTIGAIPELAEILLNE